MLKVLIVDDNAGTAHAIKQRFVSENHHADFICEAKEALRVAQGKKVEEYDYVLLDLYLNGINGIDIYNALKSRGLDTKVVFISGCDERSEIFGRALETGSPLVVKKFSAKDLVKNLVAGTIVSWAEADLKQRGIERPVKA